jgi:hypothetical protein
MEVSHLHPHTQRLMAHAHHVEGIKDCDRIGKLVSDGVGIATGGL